MWLFMVLIRGEEPEVERTPVSFCIVDKVSLLLLTVDVCEFSLSPILVNEGQTGQAFT